MTHSNTKKPKQILLNVPYFQVVSTANTNSACTAMLLAAANQGVLPDLIPSIPEMEIGKERDEDVPVNEE